MVESALKPDARRNGRVHAPAVSDFQLPHPSDQLSPLSSPVLSPSVFCLIPMRSSTLSHRLFSGVSLANLTCRPVLIVPPALPASRIGRSSWLWALPSLLPLP